VIAYLVSVLAIAVLRLGHAMEIFATVVVVQNLTSTAKERLDVLPYPRGAITDHTKSHAIFGNQARLFDLFEGLTELGLVLNLVPTQQMHDALAIDEIKPKAFDLAPLPLPRGAPGPLASLSWATAPSTFRAGRGKGAINAKNHHGSAPFTRCDLVDALVDLLT
jgi:hypothetical protein